MTFQDDRTEAERKTLTVLIGGRDSFMSGWGKAKDGDSYAFWACLPEQVFAVSEWVESRGDITLGHIDDLLNGECYKNEHCHIYAVREHHAALQGAEAS